MSIEEENQINNFLNEICNLFPEITPLMEKHEDFMTTSKMEEFANATTKAFENNEVNKAEKYLSYMSKKAISASRKEFEFIDVYYVENLFWATTKEAKELGWQNTPNNLKELYVAFHHKTPL